MNRITRIFQPGVATTIKVMFVAGMAGAYLVTFAWGYEGRQQARRWKEIACTYRVSDLARAVPGLGQGGPACDTLHRIGMTVVR